MAIVSSAHPYDRKRNVTLLVPCYNEAESIGKLISSVPRAALSRAGYSIQVVVIDNNSEDETAAVAEAHGARVLVEQRRGKGNAVRRGFFAIGRDTDYVVMIDGDDTYKISEILRLLEPLDSGFCDVVLGSRLAGKMTNGSMRFTNRFGNWFFSMIVRVFHKVNVTDTLTGYFAWRTDVVHALRPHVSSPGFAIEMEMITKQAKLGFSAYSVPITYEPRIGESSLRPIRDGFHILLMSARQLRWRPEKTVSPGAPLADRLDAGVTPAAGSQEQGIIHLVPTWPGSPDAISSDLSHGSDQCTMPLPGVMVWSGPSQVWRAAHSEPSTTRNRATRRSTDRRVTAAWARRRRQPKASRSAAAAER